MKQKDNTTEELILQEARKAFTQKGLAGARMQDIADKAGINKALVHYYFKSKENLFTIIFEQEFGKFFSHLATVLSADIPLFEKIEQVVSLDIERLSQYPDIALFVINELSHNPDRMTKRFKQMGTENILAIFQQQINSEVKKRTIKKITAQQLLINIQSLSVFPILAKPMIKKVMQLTEKQYQEMIQLRKKEVAAFIISAIKN